MEDSPLPYKFYPRAYSCIVKVAPGEGVISKYVESFGPIVLAGGISTVPSDSDRVRLVTSLNEQFTMTSLTIYASMYKVKKLRNIQAI